MNGRHELKHYISVSDYVQLRSRLRVVAKLDKNAGPDGGYKIRSLYFDNYSDKAVVEKLAGQSRREKFRLRFYNDDISFIRLEKKAKINHLCYKEKSAILATECQSLIRGDYDCLNIPDNTLFMELYSKIRYQNLRPTTIIDYRREAYVYPAGNVRVTFDSDIRRSNLVSEFLNPNLVTIPAAKAIILEIKYDGFLPDIIRDILHIGWRKRTEFSKYLVARLV